MPVVSKTVFCKVPQLSKGESVIIMVNAGYCSFVMDMLHNRSILGNKIKDWLVKHVIE
jgi:hypothetical protein